jgi:hypothetical protein
VTVALAVAPPASIVSVAECVPSGAPATVRVTCTLTPAPSEPEPGDTVSHAALVLACHENAAAPPLLMVAWPGWLASPISCDAGLRAITVPVPLVAVTGPLVRDVPWAARVGVGPPVVAGGPLVGVGAGVSAGSPMGVPVG